MDRLPSLNAALTKGRKHGLCIGAGVQSTAQLNVIYGGNEPAKVLRSNFRSLLVLGGSKTDPQTAEDMSLALGEHEVERAYRSYSGSRTGGTNTSYRHERERIVLPSQIMSLPALQGFLSLAEDRPVAPITLKYVNFKKQVEGIIEPGEIKETKAFREASEIARVDNA